MSMIQPRIIRLRDAAAYLGMDKNRFNVEVRPKITEFPVGRQGVGFDRLDLDAWVDEYKRARGKEGKKPMEDALCQKPRLVSSKEVMSGGSRNLSEENGFERALERAISLKRNSF